MRLFLPLIWLVSFSLASFGQITELPKVQKSSTQDVLIQKVEITPEATVVHLVFQSKDKAYSMPDMPPMFRDPRLLQGVSSSISIQPSAYLKTRSGNPLRFKKADGIPVAPDRKSVKPGERISFRLYFDPIPPGFERFDLVESDKTPEDGYSYWNFSGVQVVNPADPNRPVYLPLRGKVWDQENDNPLRAQVWCLTSDGKVIDSLQTSRLGAFEFELPAGPIMLRAIVPGYEPTEMSYTLRDQMTDRVITLWMNRIGESKRISDLVEEKNRFTLDQVYFSSGQATILPASFPQLDSLVTYLRENPAFKIRIEGHTDQIGDAALNQKLSLDRAYRVREYLVKKGIQGERITFVGYGDTRPKALGDSEEIRQLNRRVEFILIEED